MNTLPATTGEIYHLMSKSISGYRIFNTAKDYQYFTYALQYFSLEDPPVKFSYFVKNNKLVKEQGIDFALSELLSSSKSAVKAISYCLMPTHFHVLAKQSSENGITNMMRCALNAYTRYFNIKHERRGPLWSGRFKKVLITTDEQLMHVTRYIHLNPVVAGITDKAESWPYSSYKLFIDRNGIHDPWFEIEETTDFTSEQYRTFCEDHVSYQRDLALIKGQAID